MGSFDQSFLHIPEEVIRATIRNNQKCFVLRDAAHAKLVNKFILVSNIEADDGGAAIVAGNERVIRARLSDAKFFYETDLKTRLEDRLPKFEHIVFHEKLGTQAERIARIERLAGELAPLVGADVEKAKRAARLCQGRSAHRSGRRISRAARPDGEILRGRAGRGRSRRARASRITTARKGRTMSCRPIRCRSRSRSPTRSTRWSASGRSMRSRPGAKTLMRCGGRHWE